MDGSAAQCIKSFKFSAANYAIAWDILCKRFDNKNLIVHNHIKSFLTSTRWRGIRHQHLGIWLITFQKTTRSLETLKVSTQSWDLLIIYLVTTKFDTESLHEWEQQPFTAELPTLDEFTTFLSERADFLEKVNMHKSKSKPRQSHSIQRRIQKSFVASSSPAFIQKRYSCFNCKKPHSTFACPEFRALPLSQKKLRELIPWSSF